MRTFSGRVRSGMGNFAHWIERFQDVYFEATGVRLYPGTLNVELELEYSLPRSRMRVEAARIGGQVGVSIVPCTINGKSAFVLRTDANDGVTGDHGRNVIEIASDLRLRDEFGLKDGDLVELQLP